MRRAYLDTEFTTLNQYSYKLISLALVVPQGPELYVELTDAWTESDCSDFVLEIVLPQLDLDLYGRTGVSPELKKAEKHRSLNGKVFSAKDKGR